MCQYCSIDDDELLKLPAAEEGFCEYSTEESPSLCGRRARYASKFRYMDEHLCEEHMQEQAKDLKEGLMDFQESGETCDHSLLPNWTACGEPAGYALINTALSYVCKEHKDKK